MTPLDALVTPAAKTSRVLDAAADGDLPQRVDPREGNRQLRADRAGTGRYGPVRAGTGRYG
ncbi:hypothetical protein RB628_12310, partial [Streptomyces sp. ADMS]|uniref:hypothetical protein n=1 Tax=Streptomyces sp. ADMS TaxID=3071415 RepID=UPI00296EAF04